MPKADRGYYATLGVKKTATQEEIRKAFWRAANVAPTGIDCRFWVLFRNCAD